MDETRAEDMYNSLLRGCACGLKEPTRWICVLNDGNKKESESTLCRLSAIQLACEVVRESLLAEKLCPEILRIITVFQSASITDCLHNICVSTQCEFQKYGAIEAITALARTSGRVWNSICYVLKAAAENFGSSPEERKATYIRILSRLLEAKYDSNYWYNHPLGTFEVACTRALQPEETLFDTLPRRNIRELVLEWWALIWKEITQQTIDSYSYSVLSLWKVVLTRRPYIVAFDERPTSWLFETTTGSCPLLTYACLEVLHKGLQCVLLEPALNTVQPSVLVLARKVVEAAGGSWLDQIHYRTKPCGFGGPLEEELPTTPEVEKRIVVGDARTLRLVLLTVLRAAAMHIQATRFEEDMVSTALSCALAWMTSKVENTEWMQEEIIMEVFSEQDDQLLECLVLLLILHEKLGEVAPMLEKGTPFGECVAPNPHVMFLLLLRSFCYDHSALMDLLVSTETCALFYLVQYLKAIIVDWKGFVAAHAYLNRHSRHIPEWLGTNRHFHVESSMAVLIRLSLKVERTSDSGLITFNVNPLLRLLQKCEKVYETGQKR